VKECGHEVDWEMWAWHRTVLSHDTLMMTWISDHITKHTDHPTDFDWKAMVRLANLSFSVVVEWMYEKCPKEHWQAPKFMPLDETKRGDVVLGRRYPITSVLGGLAMYGDMDVLRRMVTEARLASEDCTSAILKGALVGGYGDILEWIRVAAIPGKHGTRKSPAQYIQEYIHSRQAIHPAAVKWLLENGDKVGVNVTMLVEQLIREGDLNALKQPEYVSANVTIAPFSFHMHCRLETWKFWSGWKRKLRDQQKHYPWRFCLIIRD